MTHLQRLFNYLAWCLKPSCEPLARFSLELSRGLVLAAFAYIFLTDESRYSTVLITLATAFGLLIIGVILNRLACNIAEKDNETDQ